jgi:hypothetical protein
MTERNIGMEILEGIKEIKKLNSYNKCISSVGNGLAIH